MFDIQSKIIKHAKNQANITHNEEKLNQNQTRNYTNDKICRQEHQNSSYYCIPYVQIARGKTEHVKGQSGRYLISNH